MTDKTLQYYNEHATAFVQGTLDVKFSELQNEFLSRIPKSSYILDCGTGSARDAKAFKDHGYKVVAIDGSAELAKLASKYLGQEVIVTTFQDYVPDRIFSGIWACASLLHLSLKDIESVMKKLARALATEGCFYVSFKYGTFSGERNGRFFTDMTEESFRKILEKIPELSVDKEFITEDARPGRESEKWLNVFLIKK